MSNPLNIGYESEDVVVIAGMRFAIDFFKAWSDDGFPVGAVIRILEREDGVLTLERLYDIEESLEVI